VKYLAFLTLAFLAVTFVSADPLSLEKRDVSDSCRKVIQQFRNDECFKMTLPTSISTSSIVDAYKSFSNNSCTAACDSKREMYATNFADACIRGYGKDDGHIARTLISVSLLARDIACMVDDIDGGYCIGKVVEQVTKAVNGSFKFDAFGDSATLIIKPFRLAALPKTIYCEDKCVKKFIVGSYGWFKMIADKLGKEYFTKGLMKSLNLPTFEDVSAFADDLNNMCNAHICNKEHPTVYIPGTPASTNATTTTSPSNSTSYEGNTYFNKTLGYIPNDAYIGETSFTAPTGGSFINGADGVVAGHAFVATVFGSLFMAFM